MGSYLRKAKVDDNQSDIVKDLRDIPGVSVEVGHDDILVGYKCRTYWFEIKNEDTVSKKSGKILESKIQDSQKKIRREWTGHYAILSSLNEILLELGISF